MKAAASHKQNSILATMDATVHPGQDDEVDPSMDIPLEQQVSFSGFLTKKGRFPQDITRLAEHENCADPLCCFGIMLPDRRMFVYAETRPDTTSWLEAFEEFVPEGVNVTSLADIEASWQGRMSKSIERRMTRAQRPNFDDDEFGDADTTLRITLYLNKNRNSGKVILMPTSIDLLTATASSLYQKACTKVFNHKGDIIESSREIHDNQVVVAARPGELFEPATLPPAVHQMNLPNHRTEGDEQSDSESDSSASSSDEDVDVEQVLVRLNTQIMPLSDKPASKASRKLPLPEAPTTSSTSAAITERRGTGKKPHKTPARPAPAPVSKATSSEMANPVDMAGYNLPLPVPALDDAVDGGATPDNNDMPPPPTEAYFDPKPTETNAEAGPPEASF